jgi:guanylate kinase
VSRGKVFVVTGPSGVGKSTLVRRVLERDRRIRFSISHTTRPPRPGEVHGTDYHFVSKDEFLRLMREGSFLEHAEYQGHHYGTSREAVEGPTSHGFDLILEVETQGAEQLRGVLPDATRIFIVPPSPEALEDRLRGRSTESEAARAGRLARAKEELAHAEQFDHRVVNDSVDKAVEQFLRIVHEARKDGR